VNARLFPKRERALKTRTEKTRRKPIIETVEGVSVRIYRTPSHGRPGFTVCHRFAGRRARKWFASEEHARDHARTQARRIAQGKGAALALSAEQAASYLRADEMLRPTGQPIELVAADHVAAWRELGGSAGRPTYTELAREHQRWHPASQPARLVSEVLTEFMAGRRTAALNGRWLTTLETMLERFAAAFHVPIAKVNGREVNTWLHALKDEDGKALGLRSKNNHRDAIRALFAFARRRKYLPHDHDELAAIDMAQAGPGRIHVYSPEEMNRILHHAATHAGRYVPYLAIRCFSGIRYEEMGRLRGEHIHRGTGYIAMDAAITKTNRRRTIQMLPALKAWLSAYPPAKGLVQPHPSTSMAPRLVELIRAAGVENRHNALRDSYITYRVAMTADIAAVSQESGNSPAMIERSYREVRLPDGRIITPKLAACWFAIRPPGKAARIVVPLVGRSGVA
jgi:hypothetical protein